MAIDYRIFLKINFKPYNKNAYKYIKPINFAVNTTPVPLCKEKTKSKWDDIRYSMSKSPFASVISYILVFMYISNY